LQMDYMNDCASMDPISARLKAFGCETREVDGHCFDELNDAFSMPDRLQPDRPRAIVANTIKGKGVSFMEGELKWHHSVPSSAEYTQAIKELESNLDRMDV
jgi:transketolase